MTDPFWQRFLNNLALYVNVQYQKLLTTVVESRVLTRITKYEINFLSKGHSTMYIRTENLKKPACASKRDMLELPTLWYLKK